MGVASGDSFRGLCSSSLITALSVIQLRFLPLLKIAAAFLKMITNPKVVSLARQVAVIVRSGWVAKLGWVL